MRILLIILFFLNTASWAQKITWFWQCMLFSTNDETVLIPIYLDIFVTNGLVDGKIRMENKEGASVYPVVGKYANNELELVTMKAMWYYLPEFSLSPYIYSLKYNPQNGYLEGSTDKQDYRFIAYQSK